MVVWFRPRRLEQKANVMNYGPPPGYGQPQQRQGYGPPQQGYGPPYGYPQGPPPPKKGMGVGSIILIAVGCAFLGTCMVCVTTMDKIGDATTKASASSASATTTTTTTARATSTPIFTATATATTEPEQPTVTVTAGKLYSDYKANEVSADARYKGNVLSVTGTVTEIRKTFADDIVVELATSNEFEGVAANMADSETATASALSKGHKTTVICKGAGMVIGSPQLSNCVFAQP